MAGIIAGAAPTKDAKLCALERIDRINANGEPERGAYDAVRGVEPERMHGVAPRCRLVSLRVLDEEGKGRSSNVIRALDYIREKLNDNPKLLRVHGVNLSIGYEFEAEMFACGQSPLCAEVNRLVQSGVVVVAAAGNTGYGMVRALQRQTKVGLTNTINDPGNAELAITVGATHRDSPHTFGVSYFSSKGPTGDGRQKPDLVAPGERIVSCAAGTRKASAVASAGQVAEGAQAYCIEDSGTSMAAPHASGAIAAFLSIRREFIGKPLEVKRIFCSTATPLGRERYFEGHGLLDLDSGNSVGLKLIVAETARNTKELTMHPIATNRKALLKVVEGTISALQSRDPSTVVAAVAAATVSSPEDVEAQRDAVVNVLENSARTLRLHNDLAAMTPRATADVRPEPPFIPEDQALSLIQSAIEEFRPEETLAAAAPFDTSDPGWLSVAFEKLKALFRGKHKFIEHTSLSSFQLSLPDQATVVLFSDWGTAEETARRVMRQITLQRPTHAIHLGDVYYSGTKKEIQRRFLDVIDAEGPPASTCTYLALNSNHEMYSGGHAYFELTLKTALRTGGELLQPAKQPVAADWPRLRLRGSRSEGSPE